MNDMLNIKRKRVRRRKLKNSKITDTREYLMKKRNCPPMSIVHRNIISNRMKSLIKVLIKSYYKIKDQKNDNFRNNQLPEYYLSNSLSFDPFELVNL
jgi:hypothetical protein